MQLTTAYLDNFSTPSSTMTRNISYKDTLFKQANLTPIRSEPTSETLHKLQYEIKSNAKDIYSNLQGGAHGHIGLLLTNMHYALIPTTPLV